MDSDLPDEFDLLVIGTGILRKKKIVINSKIKKKLVIQYLQVFRNRVLLLLPVALGKPFYILIRMISTVVDGRHLTWKRLANFSQAQIEQIKK